MKIIFVRHGEPDYITDSLTENGKLEAKLLAKRIKKWDVTDFYCSPQGRAIETARPSLEACGREAVTLDFMREFSYPIDDPLTNKHGVPWDFVPSEWTACDPFFGYGDSFLNADIIKSNPDISQNYPKVIEGFDRLLEKYGYIRKDKYYINKNAEERFLKSTVGPNNEIRNNGPVLLNGQKETTIVIFCHLGVTCLVMSHLLNLPFEVLVHGFFMPTTSITVLTSEERWEKQAYFRVQTLGDTSHLKAGNHNISPAGLFADPFQG